MADEDRCTVCYKVLPPGWFEMCPMCVYEARLKAASRISCRPPSYRSPLLTLDRETHG